MGSWSELDAIYPPGMLTPATALVVAMGHMLGETSVYQGEKLADWLPRALPYDTDLLARAERYLTEVPFEQWLTEARALLVPRQKLVIALNLRDRQLAVGENTALEQRAQQIITGLGTDAEQLASLERTLLLTHDQSVFPQ